MKKSLRLLVLSALMLTALAFKAVSAMAMVPASEIETPSASATADPKHEVIGVITAMDASGITIDGTVYNLADTSQIKGAPQVGDSVKLEFVTNPDGSLTVSEVGKSDSLGSSTDPSDTDSISTPEPSSPDGHPSNDSKDSSPDKSHDTSSLDSESGSSKDQSGSSGDDSGDHGSSPDSTDGPK